MKKQDKSKKRMKKPEVASYEREELVVKTAFTSELSNQPGANT